MLGNFKTGTKPNVVTAAHMFEQLDQATATSGAADQSVMKTNRQKFRRPLLAFQSKEIKGIAHIGEKVIAGREAAVLVEAIVICLIRVGDYQVRLSTHRNPVR
jgi:hypothetical protein